MENPLTYIYLHTKIMIEGGYKSQNMPTSPDIIHVGSDREKVMREILRDHPDESFCFLNEEVLRGTLGDFKSHFLPENPHRKIIYAVKANPRRRVLEILAEEGIDGFDCASSQEIDQVLAVDPTAAIFFNNPVKTQSAIRHATARNVRHFTVQSRREIDKILSACPHDTMPIGISVRLETPNREAKINLSEKYGATEEAVQNLLHFLKNQPHILTGLSVHTGSQNPSLRTYETAIATMSNIARQNGGVNSLNVGGGIPVNYHINECYSKTEFLQGIGQAIRENIAGVLCGNSPTVIIEPGRAMVAEAVDLAVPITAVESHCGHKRVYINDGVFTSFSDHAVHGWNYHFDALTGDGRRLPGGREVCTVFGRTCDSGDTLGQVALPAGLQEGDFLWVQSAGAYMDAQSSYFNGFLPPRYVLYNRR